MGLKRTPLKKNNFALNKGSPLKRGNSKLKSGGRIKVKPKTQEQKDVQQAQFEADRAFYLEIWNERPHICVSCGVGLYGELKIIYMEHGLPKSPNGGYPQYRYTKENVSIICPECHVRKENGFPTEKYKIKLEELKQKHLNGEL